MTIIYQTKDEHRCPAVLNRFNHIRSSQENSYWHKQVKIYLHGLLEHSCLIILDLSITCNISFGTSTHNVIENEDEDVLKDG